MGGRALASKAGMSRRMSRLRTVAAIADSDSGPRAGAGSNEVARSRKRERLADNVAELRESPRGEIEALRQWRQCG
jgi:hypothetical protein